MADQDLHPQVDWPEPVPEELKGLSLDARVYLCELIRDTLAELDQLKERGSRMRKATCATIGVRSARSLVATKAEATPGTSFILDLVYISRREPTALFDLRHPGI
jgi:hypothetical protein